MQSLREVPGFLAFTAVFVLLLMREQTFAMLFLLSASALGVRVGMLLMPSVSRTSSR